MPHPLDPDLADRFAAIVGTAHALRDQADIEPFVTEQRGQLHGVSELVLRPGSTGEVSDILKLAQETRTPIVPQGGNTGLQGAGVPRGLENEGAGEVVVSLARMNRVLDVDPVGNTMLVEAGCVLQRAQEAASEADRLFPLSLGAQGSAMIGGNIGTNAGGTGVLAYGNTRELVMGLEVVLPGGAVWDGLSRLRKDNTGYDLRHLFVGSEGTLGIVTKAVLKLFPAPRGREVAIVAVADPAAALRLFERARGAAFSQITAFELMSPRAMDWTVEFTGERAPLPDHRGWFVLLEVSSGRSREDARDLAETILGQAFEAGEASDAVIAESGAQGDTFWKLREDLSWAQKPHGASIKHDISVPVAAIPLFIEEADRAVASVCEGSRIVNFGHMGDGNLHYNVSRPEGWADADFLALYSAMNDAVYAVVRRHAGSISAEHGIGQVKRDRLPEWKGETAIAAMRAIKGALDPYGIMNPGKVL